MTMMLPTAAATGPIDAFLSGPLHDPMLSVCLLVFGLSAGMVALVYMLGSLLMNQKMLSWAKLELFELAYSVFLLAFILAFIGPAGSAVSSVMSSSDYYSVLCGPASPIETNPADYPEYADLPCHMRLAKHYLQYLFIDGTKIISMIYKSYGWKGMVVYGSFQFEFITEFAGVLVLNPFKGIYSLDLVVQLAAFDLVSKILMAVQFQNILLSFISYALFPTLLAIGLVFRSFFFTRRLGGLLMALAIALYFIFPMFYVLGGDVYYQIVMKSGAGWQSAIQNINFDPGGVSFYGKDRDKTPSQADATDYLSGITQFDYSENKKFALAPGEGNTMRAASKTSGAFGSQTGGNLPDICANYDMNMGSDGGPEWYNSDNLADLISGEYGQNFFSKMMDSVDNLQGSDYLSAVSYSDPSSIAGAHEWLSGSDFYSAFEPGGWIDVTARLLFFSLFFAFMGIMATIAGIKSLSATFGGDQEIAGLSRLI